MSPMLKLTDEERANVKVRFLSETQIGHLRPIPSDPWEPFRSMWWMDVVSSHGQQETDYDSMYRLWHTTEAEFWSPLVGADNAQRHGYSNIERAWNMVKRVSRLDRHVPQFTFARHFDPMEVC